MAPLREVASLAEGLIGEAVSIDELQARFKRDERVNELFRAALEHVGVTGERTYWDSIRLRVVPPIESHAGPQIGRIGVHRDTPVFSGAHLHASVPNTSDATRYSVELRTVYADDLTADRGAPNLDGRAPAVPLEWFRSMADGTPLREP